MRRIICLAYLLSLLYFRSFSQITITSSDIKPLGAMVTQATDTLPVQNIQPGGTGSQSWDFSSLKAHEAGVIKFVTPSQTLFGKRFPSSNLAIVIDTQTYAYLILDNNSMRLIGSASTTKIDTTTLFLGIDVNPPQSVIKFPASYNNSYNETNKTTIVLPGTAVGLPVDSLRLVSNIKRSVSIDAYGTMKLPSGSYESLRIKETSITTDSTYAFFFGVWLLIDSSPKPDTTETYNWWAKQNGLGFPVVTINITSSGTFSSVSWIKSLITNTKESQPLLEFSVYPNPAREFLKVETPEIFNGYVDLLDMNGRKVLTKNFEGFEASLDISFLIPGTYFVTLRNNKGGVTGTQQFKITGN
jgi:hypothetical protein